ncbi:MAG: AMP-binding protein [Selenomonas sp.]|nr:AMP-binding protein [Selenomonas sp.]
MKELAFVTDYLERAAAKHPDKIAVVDEARQMSYGELWQEAEAIGGQLAAAGLKEGPVALWLGIEGRSIAASQGAVLSGRAYAPLDIAMPRKRLAKIFGLLQPAVIITDEKHLAEAEGFAATLADSPRVLAYEEMVKASLEEKERLALEKAKASRTIDDALSIIFTSGSTGTPKGVISSHRMLVACTEWQIRALQMDETTVRAAQSPLYFAMGAYLDVYATLAAGGELHLLPKALFIFKRELVSEMARRKVNIIFWVPSVMRAIVEAEALELRDLPPLRTVAFCGEPMSPQILAQWRKAFPEARFSNHYGSTEVTIAAWQELEGETSLSIGQGCGEKELLILREDGSQADVGEVGEIVVRGPVASGYLGDEERTRASFGIDEEGRRYFHTGDLARRDESGALNFVSRSDAQVKHMGYRIELGEIETAATAVTGVSAAVCLFDKEQDVLTLFYAAADTLTENALLTEMTDSLPRYMWPARLERLSVMPQTQGGKIDRQALREML